MATMVEGRTWDDVIASLLAGKVGAIYRDEFNSPYCQKQPCAQREIRHCSDNRSERVVVDRHLRHVLKTSRIDQLPPGANEE